MATRQMTFMREAAQNAAIPKLTTGERKLDFLYAGKFDEIKNRGGLANGLEYVGASVLAGVGGIGEGIYDLTAGGLNALAGNKVYAENLFKDNVVGEWHQGVKERYNPGTGWSFGGDVAQGLGQSATMSIPYVGPYVFFAGVIGQSIGEGVQETGELGFKEVAYGTASGAVEGALEYFLGKGGQALGTWMKGIGGSSAAGSVASKAFSFLDDWAASAALKGVAKEMVSEASGEFVEEFLSEYIDVGLKRGFKIDENASTTLKQAAYAGLVGLASGAAMGGAVSGINSAFAYSSGQRVVNEGNADTLIKETRAMIDSLKIDKRSTKVDGLLVNLQRSMEMYDKAVASGNERGATMYLGEIKTYRGILEVSYSVQREAIRLADVDEATATRAAQYMSYEDGNNEVGKTYTAKDFYEDKNGIRTRLAAMNWAGVFMADTQAMRESAIFDAEIYADKMGAADGKGVVQDIDGAIFPENGGTFKIAAGDIQTAEGDYMRVMRTGEDSYAIGIGNDAQSARGYRSLTREQAEAEFKRIQGQVIANREKVAQAENLAAQAMQTDNLKRNGVRIESRADQASTAVPGAEAVTTEAGESQIGNSFDQSTMNAARKAVKNFDALDVDTKRRILRWVESAEGHNISKDVISGISNIIRIRGDLQVLLAEVGEGKGGFHIKNAAPGRNLIVIPSNRDIDILRETIGHEVGHEVEDAEGFDELKKAAVKATKQEERDGWEKMYREKFPDMSPEGIETEVAMKALGRRLATSKFIERYADRSMIRRIIDGGKAFLEKLRADEAGRLEIETTEKLIKMMDEALIKGEVSQNEATRESGTKRYLFIGAKADTADKMKLATAQDMIANGADPEQVRKDTGWFRGYDGKWRFEIDDFDSSLIENPNLTRHEDDGEIYFTGKLTDIFNHPELYKAYPQLKDINIVIQNTNFGVDAIYQPNSNYITLSREHFKRYTKEYYDYLNGGRKTEIEQIEQTPEFLEYNKWYDDEIAENMDATEWLKGALEARQKFFSSELGKRYHKLKYTKDGFNGEKFELGWGNEAKTVILHELQHAVQNVEGFATGTNTRDVNYDRNAGEIEAFDVGRRADLTAEQRKNTRPDIDRADVVFGKGGVSYRIAFSDISKENANNAKMRGDIVVKNEQELHNAISLSREDGSVQNNYIVSSIPEDVKFKIAQSIGENIFKNGEYVFKISSDDIRHISKHFTSVEDTVKAVYRLYDTVCQYDNVTLIREGSGQTRLKFEKSYFDYDFLSIEIASKKTRSFDLTTFYITKNNQKKGKIQSPVESINSTHRGVSPSSDSSIAQKSEKSTASAKKSHNLTEDAAEQAARDADQREQELRKRERKVSKAEREAEISRIETRARDYNAYYYKYEDIKSLIDTINKEAKLGFDDVSDAAFEAYSLLNAFRAAVYKADYRQSFLETTTDYLIEAADTQAGRELRLGDVDRRKKVYKMLNEAYEKLAKVTPKQKTEGRRARAEAEAQFEHKTAELHMLLNRVDQRNFRYKTAGILEGEAWKMVTKAARSMRTRGANIRFGDMKTFAEAYTAYLRSKATSLYSAAKSMTEESLKEWNKQVAEGDNELYKRININTAKAIIEFAEGNDTDFTDSNIAATVAALKTVLAVDAYTDKFINANGEAVDAEAIVADEIEGMRKSYGGIAGKLARTTFGKALRYGIYNVISPEAVAHRIDGIFGAGYLSRGIRAIQRSSLDAQYDQMTWLMPITDFIQKQKKSNKQWWKEWQNGSVTITYSLPFGKGEVAKRTITLTKGEAASLYLTSKREQAKAALALGRISVTDAEGRRGDQFSHRRFNMDAIDEWLDQNKFEGMTDEEVNGIVIQLEQAMQTAINGMYEQFSATDKAFIDKISTFYQTTSKQVKQASDTRYYGSTNVFDGFYYPIARSGLEFDFDFIGSNMRGLDDVSLRNYPFNKSTVKGARAQLQINDILVVLDRHSRQLAMYKNLTIPMQNLRLVYNHRLTEGAKENIDTVRKYINEYIWPSQNGRGGFDQWIGDFSNAVQKRNIGGKTEFDTVLDKIQGGYVVAALGLNPSSVAKQWSTIMQMVEEVPMHIWMKAYAPAENKDKMTEKSRYAAIRANSPELYRAQGATAELSDVMSYTLKGLEWGDRLVNLRMWNMAQYYIAETKGYAVGSEQNLNAAGKLLDEWIMRFQDTSDASTKSALQRHPQNLAQAVTMFTSAPMKKFSAWYTYLTDAVEAKRMLDSGKLSTEDRKRAEKILADSKKKLAKSSGGIVAAAAFETAITLMWAALRGKDDEDEEKKKSLVAKIALETSANVVGIVPVAGQIAESLLSGYDIDNMYESVINDGIGTVRTTYQLSAKAISGETVESEAVMRNARSWVYLISQATGVPVRNFNNVFTSALNIISPVVPEAKYKYEAIFYEPTYAADMSKALKSGDTKLAETIYTMAQKDTKTGGAADRAVVGEMVRLYGLEYNVLPRSAPTSYEDAEGNTVKLKAAQARQFSEIYGAADGAAAMVVTSPVYTALPDELKAKALRVVYEVYHSRAKSEVLGAEPSVMAALSYFDGYLDIPTLVTESAYIYGIKSTEDAKRSELVREYVAGYSREAQALLLYAAGYRSEDIKETLSDMILQLDEATRERVAAKIDVN